MSTTPTNTKLASSTASALSTRLVRAGVVVIWIFGGLVVACRDDGVNKDQAAANAAALKASLPSSGADAGAGTGVGVVASPAPPTKGRAPDDPHTVALARAARDAATKLASACYFAEDYQETHHRFYDVCRWKPPELEPMRAAATTFLTAAPDAGEGAIFAEHVKLFAEWIELIKERSIPGTLAHYQDLAAAWNSYQPNERVPVDLGQINKYSEYAPPDGGPDGGPRQWQRCSSGACIIVPTKPQR